MISFLTVGQPGVASQSEWNEESLMMQLAEVKEADLSFIEHRTSGFLIDKIKLTGTMRYRAPDMIEKSVETPFVENIKIKGDRISVEKISDRGESSIKTYSLSSMETLNTTVEGVRATLSGNLTLLKHNYELELTGDASNWNITLTPKTPKMREFIEKITVSGRHNQISVIETFDADGDESRLDLSYLPVK